MLESMFNFKEVSKKPYYMFVWALIIGTVAVLVASQVPYTIPVGSEIINLTGLFVVLFTIIPSVYFVTMMIKKEESLEEWEIEKHYQKSLWKRHERDIMVFAFYFAGLTLSFAIWSFMLPSDFFYVQIAKITEIRGIVASSGTEGFAVSSLTYFNQILINNLQVMTFAFLFSLIFGAGAVFILVWNASVLGVYIGQLSKFIWHIPIVSLSFLPHGVPEILGYLCAGLAGGIISAALLRGHHKKGVLRIVILDCVKILLIGVFFIILGAGIEAYM